MTSKVRRLKPVIEVHQWLESWNDVAFDATVFQSRPPKQFYIFKMRASELKSLTGVYRRSARATTARALDPNVQRGHEEDRSATIRDFVQFGYPWCDMSPAKRKAEKSNSLKKPGWLPTAILINILQPDDVRNGKTISPRDLAEITIVDGSPVLALPSEFTNAGWRPETIFPFEVIDGQHRLWAFEDFDAGDEYELPVVAFSGLDRSWQAYLFWSVNITPKKINRSLAFDLYPLLRQEEWLDKFSGHSIYRESRAQELVEALWGNELSPWYKRINMLGETTKQLESRIPMVSQAAWIRSLLATFIKQWEGSGTKIGGLFGAPIQQDKTSLPWNRAMQAAFLILAGQRLKEAVFLSTKAWAINLRETSREGLFEDVDDSAFYGTHSLLTTDQGIRGYLNVVNDLCFVARTEIQLSEWRPETLESNVKGKVSATAKDHVTVAIGSLKTTKIDEFLTALARALAGYDWRTSSTPELTESERLHQAIFRGSSGYKELRRELLQHIANENGICGDAASRVLKMLGY